MNIKVQLTRQSNVNYFNTELHSIQEIDLEQYVAAVVASEIGNGNIEACCAQAIAARTFAVARGVLEGQIISDSSATAQAYRAERYSIEKYPNCIEGAKRTKSLILTYKGKPISAVYSASNGGCTVSSKEKWGSARAYLIAQDDPWDAAVGKKKNGHGVGMSQTGCGWAATHGYNYKQILNFYYPNTELKQVMSMISNQKAEGIVTTAKNCLGYPYVFAAWGENCTPANRRRRSRADHPMIVDRCQVLKGTSSSCDGCKYEGTQIFDCRGFTYYCLKANNIIINGQGATSQYNDKSNWLARGPISEMPNVVCCLFQQNGSKMKHTGLHIGDGKIIHCSVEVKNDTTARKDWTHYAIPYGIYSKEELAAAEVLIVMPTLKRGSKGDAVKELQELLLKLGYDPGGIDGSFGGGTAEAVRKFQADHNIGVDGIVGNETWKALKEESVSEQIVHIEEPEEETPGVDLEANLLLMQLKVSNLLDDLACIEDSINTLLEEFQQIKKGET